MEFSEFKQWFLPIPIVVCWDLLVWVFFQNWLKLQYILHYLCSVWPLHWCHFLHIPSPTKILLNNWKYPPNDVILDWFDYSWAHTSKQSPPDVPLVRFEGGKCPWGNRPSFIWKVISNKTYVLCLLWILENFAQTKSKIMFYDSKPIDFNLSLLYLQYVILCLQYNILIPISGQLTISLNLIIGLERNENRK